MLVSASRNQDNPKPNGFISCSQIKIDSMIVSTPTVQVKLASISLYPMSQIDNIVQTTFIAAAARFLDSNGV